MQKTILIVSSLIILVSCGQLTSRREPTKKEINEAMKELREKYISSYNGSSQFQEVIREKTGDSIRMFCNYYCLFDSAIVLPGKYVWEDTTKTFTTHNFAEDIVLIKHGDTILQKTITKKDFESRLPKYLKDYAVILEPNFEGYDSIHDRFKFNCSISIPVTDVGQLMNFSISKRGETLITELVD